MADTNHIALLEARRDSLRDWLDDEAPFTEVDQKHLDADTPERAYWHHGYQAALADIIEMLMGRDEKSDSVDTPM
ncbi:MAG: hypothetical protein AB7K67_15465 [Hyphomicrobiaceae bacterium]|jgi:hypothetical protein